MQGTDIIIQELRPFAIYMHTRGVCGLGPHMLPCIIHTTIRGRATNKHDLNLMLTIQEQRLLKEVNNILFPFL